MNRLTALSLFALVVFLSFWGQAFTTGRPVRRTSVPAGHIIPGFFLMVNYRTTGV